MTTDSKVWRVLSFDGGGIRGILTLETLDRISKRLGNDGWLNGIDLFAGTSTGGLIALGLAAGKSIDELKSLYVEHGEDIFSSAWKSIPILGKTGIYLKNIFASRYDNKVLAEQLKRQLGDITLGQLGKKVIIATFDIDGERGEQALRWKAKFFHNFEGVDKKPEPPHKRSDRDTPAWKVGMYTCCAPTYFPAYEGYVDGGVVAPNPCMAALAQLQDPRYFIQNNVRPHPNQKPYLNLDAKIEAPAIPNGIRMLSIGTGETPQRIKDGEGKRIAWGFTGWIWPFSKPQAPLISLMTNGDTNVSKYQVEQLLGDNFRRLQLELDQAHDFDLDDADQIKAMLAYLDQDDKLARDIEEAADWIRRWPSRQGIVANSVGDD